MRLIHSVPFSAQERESYRQLIFNNLTEGMKYLLDAMEEMDLKLSEANEQYYDLVANARDIRDHEAYPNDFYEPLKALWLDPGVQSAWERGNEAALPEKYVIAIRFSRPYFCPCARRLIGVIPLRILFAYTWVLRQSNLLLS
jgi:guanine nucleotide-binding protein subunit alpha, other